MDSSSSSSSSLRDVEREWTSGCNRPKAVAVMEEESSSKGPVSPFGSALALSLSLPLARSLSLSLSLFVKGTI